jgi:hypothetical protein
MLYTITSKDVAHSMQEGTAICLKASKHVWQISDTSQQNYVVKYMNHGEAVQHAQNALLYKLVGLPTVDSHALKNDDADLEILSHVEDKESVNGILAMPFLPGKPLSQYKKTLDTDERSELFRWLKENTLAACVIACHTDPNDTNIQCDEPDGELTIEFIDPEYALASTEEIPVEELYEQLTTNHRSFPHYTITDYDHEAVIENTAEIVQHLKLQVQSQEVDPQIASYVPRMIERGEELIEVLHRKNPIAMKYRY